VVFGYLWAWILDPNVGPLNKLLSALTGGTVSFAWLATPGLTLWVVAFVFVWAHWSFGFLIFLSGLQSVPRELTEAAQLDGANGRQQFRYVVWPVIAPVAVVVSVVSLLLAMQIFGTVFVLTNGGPGYSTQVPTLLIYQEAFVNFRVGRAAAMSVIFGVVLVMCSGLQVLAARRWSHE
jgi:ABC-type sugar transport system permease subunit